MPNAKPYFEYDVWKEAHRLNLEVCEMTKSFPIDERFVMASQIRRAAMSVAANIVEGVGRNSPMELRRFLVIAIGSARETHYFVMMAKDLKYISPEKATTLLHDYEGLAVGLHRFIGAIENRLNNREAERADTQEKQHARPLAL